MSKDLNNIIPARQMSGRRSKPSMELLIDNQRILSQYIVPKKVYRQDTIRHHLDNINQSNLSEKSPISVKKIPKPKKTKLNAKSSKDNIYNPKTVSHKRKLSLPIVNGAESAIESEESEEVKDDQQSQDILTHTPYVTLRLNKIDINDPVISSNKEKSNNKKEDDDLPLSKVYPDFKPHTSPTPAIVATTKRPTLVLPPKKKIKFVNINELNGNNSTIIPSPGKSIPTVVIKLSPNQPQSITQIMDMPKIPKIKKKKVRVNGNSSDSATAKTTAVEDKRKEEKEEQEEEHKQEEENDHGVEDPPNESGRSTRSSVEVAAPSVIENLPPKETPRRCVRDKCTNVAIDDFRWDREFCSPDCAIGHSKYLFREWLCQKRESYVEELQI